MPGFETLRRNVLGFEARDLEEVVLGSRLLRGGVLVLAGALLTGVVPNALVVLGLVAVAPAQILGLSQTLQGEEFWEGNVN